CPEGRGSCPEPRRTGCMAGDGVSAPRAGKTGLAMVGPCPCSTDGRLGVAFGFGLCLFRTLVPAQHTGYLRKQRKGPARAAFSQRRQQLRIAVLNLTA